MRINGWKYYNHAAIADCAPHESPDTGPLENGSVWAMDGCPLFAEWTTDYDCGYETDWWYCVMDRPFDLLRLKAKRRYVINKGNRLFDVKEIFPPDYKKQLSAVQEAAFSAYPEKYRPKTDEHGFYKWMDQLAVKIHEGKCIFYGAFYRETQTLCGYLIVAVGEDYQECDTLKTDPAYEKYQVNAALVYRWVVDAGELIRRGGYIENGTRTINHETAFQEYLERYFGFRKAYCLLHIRYRPGMGLVMALLRKMKHIFIKFDSIGIVHQINALLRLDACAADHKK